MVVVWLTRYRDDARASAILEDARARAASGFDFLEGELGENTYLLGDAFSAADVMMGFTLGAASLLGLLDERHPRARAYLARLQQRPALQKALSIA